MKQYIRNVVTVLLIVAMLPVCCFAKSTPVSTTEIIFLEDGSYITIALEQTESRASGTKTASKTYTYRDSSDAIQWKAVLRGTFSYTGSSATCTAASCDVTISNTSWSESAKNVSKSGNSAVCQLTMGKKFIGITIDKETVNMRLTCDANGNLS